MALLTRKTWDADGGGGGRVLWVPPQVALQAEN